MNEITDTVKARARRGSAVRTTHGGNTGSDGGNPCRSNPAMEHQEGGNTNG